MSIESSIDSQYETYDNLLFQHENTRREKQTELLQTAENLSETIQRSLLTDKTNYANTKKTFYQKYNLVKRFFGREASEYKHSSLRPCKYLYIRREDLSKKVNDLIFEIRAESNPLEIRTCWNGSIAVVYHPITGRTEWRESRQGSIHGVFNPHTRTIEWRDEQQAGIYGVFNPKLNIVEWKAFAHGGVHGVYNPLIKEIEWQTAFNSGIGGVYNSRTRQVDWKTSFNGGVVGYFDDESETVKWTEKWHHGLALIQWNPRLNTYSTSASYGWYGRK